LRIGKPSETIRFCAGETNGRRQNAKGKKQRKRFFIAYVLNGGCLKFFDEAIFAGIFERKKANSAAIASAYGVPF
jgi:hypothetical protein